MSHNMISLSYSQLTKSTSILKLTWLLEISKLVINQSHISLRHKHSGHFHRALETTAVMGIGGLLLI